MPPIIVAVAAAAAAAATTAAVSSALVAGGYFLTAAGTLSALGTVVAGVAGALVAAGVSYAGSAILGLNRSPKAPSATRAAQDRRQMIRSSIAPRAVVYGRARVSGPMIYASSSGADKRFLHLVVPVAGHRVAGMDAVWINDNRIPVADINGSGFVTTGPLANKARIRFYNGTQTAADPDLVAESADGWSNAHALRGVAYIYARLEYDADAFPNGIQNLGAEIRGKSDILDPRTGATGYSENAALCVLDYLRSPDGLACSADEIDTASFIAAANVCDEAVQIAAGGATQARYVIGGGFTLDRAPIDVMDEMLGACGGTLVYVQGRYRLHAGAYTTPTDTLTVSDLAGAIQLQTKTPRRELFNGVRGTFIDPTKNWQAADFPPVSESDAVTADGEAIFKDIELPFTNDATRAQRLARLALRRAREALTIRVPVRYAGIRYSVWQMLSVTVADFGWTNKPFRITAWTFDAESGVVTLTLREESAFSYAWTFDEADSYGPAPDTALVSPFDIPAPVGLGFTEELYVTQNGAGVRTRAILIWEPPAFPFVSAYDVQVREAAGTDWRNVVVTQGEHRAVAEDLADGLYVWRVRARSLVASGAWAELQARVGVLAAVPPSPVTGLAVQTIGGLAFLRWDRHPDLDVRVGGRIEIRHTPETGAPSWAGSTSIGEAIPGDATFAALPLKPGTYLAKAVDQGGRYSSSVAFISTAQATALQFANIATLTEHPSFNGAKTGVFVDASTLRLEGAALVDGASSWDAISDIDAFGGIAASGSYQFSGGIDQGTVKPVRITGRVRALIVSTLDQIDQRAGNLDDWLDFDGVAGNEADAWIEVRETNDNPAGSPVWSAWRRVDQAEFRARAFQARAELRSYDASRNIHVTELSVTADEVI